MPSYNQQLQTNNSSLEEIITQLNNMPDAGNTVEDLDAELTTQENLISQLSTILDSKASGGTGGGNIETCTLRVFDSTGTYRLSTLIYEGLRNGERTMIPLCNVPGDITAFDYTVSDAICGGFIVAVGMGTWDTWHTATNVTAILYAQSMTQIFKITAPANGSAELQLRGDD